MTVVVDVPPAAPVRAHPSRTLDYWPPGIPKLRSISLESRISHVADMCVYCNTKWSFIEATTAVWVQAGHGTGRCGYGGLVVCTVEAYPRLYIEGPRSTPRCPRTPSQAKSTPVDLNVFWTPGRRSLHGIPEGKLIESVRASSALFIHGSRQRFA